METITLPIIVGSTTLNKSFHVISNKLTYNIFCSCLWLHWMYRVFSILHNVWNLYILTKIMLYMPMKLLSNISKIFSLKFSRDYFLNKDQSNFRMLNKENHSLVKNIKYLFHIYFPKITIIIFQFTHLNYCNCFLISIYQSNNNNHKTIVITLIIIIKLL